MELLSVEEIRRALRDRRLRVVARATGLHYNTLWRLREGRGGAPKLEVLEKLTRYLRSTPPPDKV
jgi:transcriptional regulator with XRE-family HTH domain